MKLTKLYSFLNKDLDAVENEVLHSVTTEEQVLEEASNQLLEAGGKRIRPVFVLLSGKFGKYDFDKMKNCAKALELIHTGSLVHDDVIDDAKLRRGDLTVKEQYDNHIAMYTGDYMFALALEAMGNIENMRAHQVLSKTMMELCIGEIEQIKDKGRVDQNLRTYLRRIKRKTAILIAESCRLGAIAGEVPRKKEVALYNYGYNVGMSYQIIDDVLDFTASEEELGKPAGSDLMQGNITLPVLYAIQEDEAFRDNLRAAFSESSTLTKEQAEPFIKVVKEGDYIEKSLRLSERYLENAFDSLQHLPTGRPKQALKAIAKYIGKRNS
ncbi:heptaprenyl diphosphate synthase component II [Salimicrobium halophilum]|uniref:Heptaprenyl diphosphate synthase component 2 n=1 Tax=Salimicrobium halophilum TaxID=86666 RepID=A0A1G8Q0C5_9BACI|nr:heptaprenyl diphosphate synthase component II [Salimicrobium halophilum]SDI98147.1 heptaprenyl diphosphate synthase [Salimicrobium halophilum]